MDFVEYFLISSKCLFNENSSWHIDENKALICYENQNYCLSNKYYYHNDTKECVLSNCRNGYYRFNFECYKDGCPDNTTNNISNESICESILDFCYIDINYKTHCSNKVNIEYTLKYENSKIYFNNCNDSLFFFNTTTYLYNNSCLNECPNQTFPNKENKTCENFKYKTYNIYNTYINYSTSIIYNNIKTDIIELEKTNALMKKNNFFNTSWSDFKKLILKNITAFTNSSLVIYGSDFTSVILTSDNMDPKEQLEKGVSAIDLGNCGEIIKDYYNISQNESLIVLNTELKSNENNNILNNSNSFNLGKNVQIEIYDSSGRKLNLYICKENIKVMMNIKEIEQLDIKTAKQFTEKGIDIFNPNDEFFNELCLKFDSIDNRDIILEDRRNDIFKNATFCQDGCTYTEIDFELMAANCMCNSSFLQEEEKNITEKEGTKLENVNFKSLAKSFISNLLDFNIDVVLC